MTEVSLVLEELATPLPAVMLELSMLTVVTQEMVLSLIGLDADDVCEVCASEVGNVGRS